MHADVDARVRSSLRTRRVTSPRAVVAAELRS